MPIIGMTMSRSASASASSVMPVFPGRAARRWAGVVHLAEIDRARRQIGGQNLHALRFQMTDRVADGTMGFDADPAVAAGGGGNQGAHAGGGPHGVDLMHADGVGGADNGGDVMRLVHLLQADRQIRLPGREHFTNPRIAFRTHKR